MKRSTQKASKKQADKNNVAQNLFYFLIFASLCPNVVQSETLELEKTEAEKIASNSLGKKQVNSSSRSYAEFERRSRRTNIVKSKHKSDK